MLGHQLSRDEIIFKKRELVWRLRNSLSSQRQKGYLLTKYLGAGYKILFLTCWTVKPWEHSFPPRLAFNKIITNDLPDVKGMRE